MNILAIESAYTGCSVALRMNETLLQKTQCEPRMQKSQLLPMVDTLLAEAGLTLSALDALAFGEGPGSFTGLRIAASVVQGLALSQGLPVIGVSSLQAMAYQAHIMHPLPYILVAMDARMKEVYWGCYHCQDGIIKQQASECVIAAELAPCINGNSYLAVGSGFLQYRQSLIKRYQGQLSIVEPNLQPEAAAIASLANMADAAPAEQALPVYLRNNVTS